jgi:hypothetical protein
MIKEVLASDSEKKKGRERDGGFRLLGITNLALYTM